MISGEIQFYQNQLMIAEIMTNAVRSAGERQHNLLANAIEDKHRLKNQINSLRAAKDKAAEYAASCSERANDLSLNLEKALHDQDNLQTQLDKATTEIKNMQQKLAEVKKESSSLRADCEQKSICITQLEEKAEDLSEHVDSLELELAETSSDCERKVSAAQQRCQDLEERFQRQKETVGLVNSKLKEVHKELDLAKDSRMAIHRKSSKLEQENKVCQTKIKELDKQIALLELGYYQEKKEKAKPVQTVETVEDAFQAPVEDAFQAHGEGDCVCGSCGKSYLYDENFSSLSCHFHPQVTIFHS